MGTIEPIYKEIGKRIQKYRRLKGFTQEKLANEIGLTRTSVVHIENGNQKFTIHCIYKIAEVLDLLVVDLLPEVERTKDPLDLLSKARLNERTQRQVLKIIKNVRREGK